MAVKDLFSHPTIQELAAYIRDSDTSSSQAPIEGDVQWSPVFKMVSFSRYKEKHHFNQSVIFASKHLCTRRRTSQNFKSNNVSS